MIDPHRQKILDRAIEEMQKAFSDILGIYLFGSFASQYESSESDLDLAILAEKPLSSVALWNLAQEIARFIHRDVDIVDLRQASTVFRFQIITSGQRIFCAKPSECDQFENSCASMYLFLNEERREILEDYKQQGETA